MDDYSARPCQSQMPPQLCCSYHPDASLVEDYHAGDMICTECGLVVGDRIVDVGAEWRNFDDQPDEFSVGAAEEPLLDVNEMSATSDNKNETTTLKNQTSRNRNKSRRSVNRTKRALETVCLDISQMAAKLNVPNILVENTCSLFKKVHLNNVQKGHGNKALASVCLFISCQWNGVPQSFEAISAVSKIGKRELRRLYKKISCEITSADCMVIGVTSTLEDAFEEISDMADRLHLPKLVVDSTQRIFNDVKQFLALKDYNPDSVIAACTYIACRREGVPQTFKEMSAVSSLHKGEIGRAIKQIVNSLKLTMPNVTPGDFMPRFCAKLMLPFKTEKTAAYIARKANKLDLVRSWKPECVAAAAIYLASQVSTEKRTTKEIMNATGVLQHTIIHVYKLIRPKALLLFPADFKFSTPIDKLPTK